jgi:hypothetical protein
MQEFMAGRPQKIYSSISETIYVTDDNGNDIPFGSILVLCPICYSSIIGPYGFQTTKTGTWQKYQCKNRNCPWLKDHRKKKQFVLKTSALFNDALRSHLNQVIIPLIQGDTTQSIIGTHNHCSPALMTYIRHKVEYVLDQQTNLEHLTVEKPMDDGVAVDEWFLKINGKAVYVIMATSYGKRKILGVKVALSRDELMMRRVFDEAERNNGKEFSLITIDAWGGSMKMIKNLTRPITAVIHKHKAPYDKAVIWRIEYTEKKRIIHQIGLKTNFFRHRKTREYYYLKEEEDLIKPNPKK